MFGMRGVLIIFYCFYSSSLLFSQAWEIGGWLGAANYFGDLNTYTSFKYLRPAGGFILKKNYNDYISLRHSINAGIVSFDDSDKKAIYQKDRNLSFYSEIVELSSQLEMNFFKYKLTERDHRFTPYIFAGIGIFYFNPRTVIGDTHYRLRQYSTEGQGLQGGGNKYSILQVSFPIGMGLRFALNNFWTLGIEVGNRKTSTDYLDDVSTTYFDKIVLLSSQNADAVLLSDRSELPDAAYGINGKQRGDSQKNDSYLFMGVSLTYRIRKVRCPYP